MPLRLTPHKHHRLPKESLATKSRRFNFLPGLSAVVGALFLLGEPAFAEPSAQIQDDIADPSSIDRLHTGVGGTVRRLAERLDRFFGDQRIDEEEQDSTLRLEPVVKWEDGESPDLSLRIRLNLELPRLEERWHLMLRSVSEGDDIENVDDLGVSMPEMSSDTDTQTLLGLRFAPIAKQLEHLSFSGGAKLRGGGVHPFLRARYRKTYDFTQWSAEFTQRFFWFSDDGFGERTRIMFERRLGAQTTFRATSRATWSETSQGVDLEQFLTLRRFHADDKATELSLRAEGHTRPSTVVDAYIGQIAYRQTVYEDWIFSEVGVQARFPREEDWDFTPGIFTSLAFVF